jgi:hypothetical protein
MAWGLGGFGASYRAPAPRRLSQLTLEDLVGALGEPAAAPAPRPAPVTNLRDLQGPDRRQAQQESLWAGLAALGANLSGDRRGAVAGIGDIQAAQDRALAGANARQEAQWQAENEQRAAASAEAKHQQEASALYGMYQRVTEGEAPDSPFAQRAETAARAGSMAELTKLDAERPMRDAARAKGYNPDAFAVGERIRAELEAETKRLNDQKAWDEGEKARLEEKARIDAEAETAKRVAQRDKGVLWEPPQYEPLDRIAARTELVESIRDKHESTRAGGVAGKIGKVGETWGWLAPPDKEHPHGSFAPLDGQPQSVGEYTYFTIDGQRYVQDKNRPQLGAFPVELHEEGHLPAPGAPAPSTKKAAPPPAPSSAGLAAAAMGFPAGSYAPSTPKKAAEPKSPAAKAAPQRPTPTAAPSTRSAAPGKLDPLEIHDVGQMLRDLSDPKQRAKFGVPGESAEEAARTVLVRAGGKSPDEADALLRAAKGAGKPLRLDDEYGRRLDFMRDGVVSLAEKGQLEGSHFETAVNAARNAPPGYRSPDLEPPLDSRARQQLEAIEAKFGPLEGDLLNWTLGQLRNGAPLGKIVLGIRQRDSWRPVPP